jgi:hypothetical protein
MKQFLFVLLLVIVACALADKSKQKSDNYSKRQLKFRDSPTPKPVSFLLSSFMMLLAYN